jgi:hypothetical protein
MRDHIITGVFQGLCPPGLQDTESQLVAAQVQCHSELHWQQQVKLDLLCQCFQVSDTVSAFTFNLDISLIPVPISVPH